VYYSAIRQVIWSGRGAAITVYPNPTPDGAIRIDWSTQPGQNLEISVTDIAGRIITKWSEKAQDYSNTTLLDLSSAARGVYFLHARLGDEQFDIKVIRQ
jgi:hypothetical protein